MSTPIDRNRVIITPPPADHERVLVTPPPSSPSPVGGQTLSRLLAELDKAEQDPNAKLHQRVARSMLADEVAKQIEAGTFEPSLKSLPPAQQQQLVALERDDSTFRDTFRSKLPNKFASEDLSRYFVAAQGSSTPEGAKNVSEVLKEERELRGEAVGGTRTAKDATSSFQHAVAHLAYGGAATQTLDAIENFIKTDLRGKKKPKELLAEVERARQVVTNVNIEAEGMQGVEAAFANLGATLDKKLTPNQRRALSTQLVNTAQERLRVPTPEEYASMSPRERRQAMDPKVLENLSPEVRDQLTKDLGFARQALDPFKGVASTSEISDADKAGIGEAFRAFATSSVGPIMSEAQIAKLPAPVQERAREFNTARRQYMMKAEAAHSEIMSLLNNPALPFEYVIFMVMALFAQQSEEKLKLKMKEMALADQMERSGGQMKEARAAGGAGGPQTEPAQTVPEAAADAAKDAASDGDKSKDPAQAGQMADQSTPNPMDNQPVDNFEDAGILMKSSTQLNQEVQAAMSAMSQMMQALQGVMSAIQSQKDNIVRMIGR